MSNSNKKDSDEKEVIKKEEKIDLRISTIEKELFKEEAKKRTMNLSEFIMSTMRLEIRGKQRAAGPIVDNALLQQIIERLEKLEKLVSTGNLKLNTIADAADFDFRDIEKITHVEFICKLLQLKEFKKKTQEEILRSILEKYPDMGPIIEPSPNKLYTPLDLAIRRLEKEGSLRISSQGNFNWED